MTTLQSVYHSYLAQISFHQDQYPSHRKYLQTKYQPCLKNGCGPVGRGFNLCFNLSIGLKIILTLLSSRSILTPVSNFFLIFWLLYHVKNGWINNRFYFHVWHPSKTMSVCLCQYSHCIFLIAGTIFCWWLDFLHEDSLCSI